VWELIWLMLIMKIPILYLCWVVYWAIKSEPERDEPATVRVVDEEPPSGWRPRRRPRPGRSGPHGRPTRTYARSRRAVIRA
jgi:hypothetical protein